MSDVLMQVKMEAKFVNAWLMGGVPREIASLHPSVMGPRCYRVMDFIVKSGADNIALLKDFFEYDPDSPTMTDAREDVGSLIKACGEKGAVPVHSIPVQLQHFKDCAEEFAREEADKAIKDFGGMLGRVIPKSELGDKPMGSRYGFCDLLPKLYGDLSEIRAKIEVQSNEKHEFKEFSEPEDPRAHTGCWWGLDALDDLTLGVRKGRVAIVGAFTAEGKSTYTRYMSAYNSLIGYRGLYISLEIDSEEVSRMTAITQVNIAQGTCYSTADFRDGKVSVAELNRLLHMTRSEFPESSNIDFRSPRDEFSVTEFEALVKEGEYDFAVVDYLGLMDAPKAIEKGATFNRILSYSFKKLKDIAMKYDIAVVVPHQINREGAKKRDKDGKYGLYDLGDSSGTERTADFVVMLSANEELRASRVTEISMPKSRWSATLPVTKFGSDFGSGVYTDLHFEKGAINDRSGLQLEL